MSNVSERHIEKHSRKANPGRATEARLELRDGADPWNGMNPVTVYPTPANTQPSKCGRTPSGNRGEMMGRNWGSPMAGTCPWSGGPCSLFRCASARRPHLAERNRKLTGREEAMLVALACSPPRSGVGGGHWIASRRVGAPHRSSAGFPGNHTPAAGGQ
jgi:hypothetical protein